MKENLHEKKPYKQYFFRIRSAWVSTFSMFVYRIFLWFTIKEKPIYLRMYHVLFYITRKKQPPQWYVDCVYCLFALLCHNRNEPLKLFFSLFDFCFDTQAVNKKNSTLTDVMLISFSVASLSQFLKAVNRNRNEISANARSMQRRKKSNLEWLDVSSIRLSNCD